MSQQIINKITGEIVDKFDKVKKGGNIMFLEDKEINFAAKVLLSYMLSSGSHGIFSGSHLFLCEKLGMHPVSISKYIKQLKDKGYVMEITVQGKKAYKINPSIGE